MVYPLRACKDDPHRAKKKIQKNAYDIFRTFGEFVYILLNEKSKRSVFQTPR